MNAIFKFIHKAFDWKDQAGVCARWHTTCAAVRHRRGRANAKAIEPGPIFGVLA